MNSAPPASRRRWLRSLGKSDRRDAASGAKLRRHLFEDTLRSQIRPLLKSDNWHGFLELVEDWTIIGSTVAVSEWSRRHLPFAVWLGVYVVAIFVIGIRHRALADLLHQAAHRTLAKNGPLNFVMGTFLSGYFVLQSYTAYRHTHISRHHSYLGDLRADPDYKGLYAAGLYGDGMTSASVRRYVRRLAHPTTTFQYLAYVWNNRIWNRHESIPERAVRTFYIVGLLTASVVTGVWPLVVLYWLVPILTTANWVGSFIELMEHYPYMETRPNLDILASKNRICSWPVQLVLGVHAENYHLVHHLFPAMPNWNFAKAHQLLLADPLYAEIHRRTGLRNLLFDIFNPESPDYMSETLARELPSASVRRRPSTTSISDEDSVTSFTGESSVTSFTGETSTPSYPGNDAVTTFNGEESEASSTDFSREAG